ncbi:S8 family serine peptidase [Pseudoalteromonas sp. NEC-BIFX-2020_015]|uniref:S8 family serine peptidase n=1 Tax=Pseudoalteromonas sp. NEC-BIFX-2020_015 TaxID=2729544 RepID=UPI0014615AB6|nr:S8 family serine peptidase [Pseudoalteromonas sp. NEC-BIFX-2020_015]NMR24574.1 S8 family serine peptidase [Pseudoalteromonas sp. NEC-BIFX-2020_015]
MKNNIFKISALSAAVVVSLAGCGSDNNKAKTVPVVQDSAPTASDFAIADLKQWIPVTGEITAKDADGDALSFSFTENDKEIEGVEGVYTFSHGILTVDGKAYTYVSTSGEDAEIDYTVSANSKSASAKINIVGVANDPLAIQQWHLRNTGQKAYALSDEMKKGMINLYVTRFGFTEEAATTRINEDFAKSEEELVAGEDMNVSVAYAMGVTGQGVTAVVVDSGMEIRHEDLIDNVLPNRSINLNVEVVDRTDPTSTANSGDHGTSVAGLIAAKGWNGLGGRGVAPDTGLIGMNLLGGDKIPQTDLLVHGFPGSGISKSENISAFNRSYGITFPTFISYSELNEAIESYPNIHLRDGKGALNIKSSGNAFDSDENEGSLCKDNGANELGLTCYNGAFEPSQSHPYYFSVAAVNANGKHTSYSTAGANVMVSAPAGEFGRFSPAMVTTDQMTCINGYSGFNGRGIASWAAAFGEEFAATQYPFNYPGHADNESCNYTSSFNGTSSAAPNASGVVSLILSANPDLTWRDVRHILASTSTLIDADNAEVKLTVGEGEFVAHEGWVENSAGYNFNNLYGFGRVDAGAAVAKAKNYDVVLGEEVISSWIGAGSAVGEDALALEIPDNSATGLTHTIEVAEELNIEAIQFKFDVSNSEMLMAVSDGTQTSAGTDLAIEVTSPSGTRSVLLSSKQALFLPALNFSSGFLNGYILKDAVMLSNAFYGESTKGTWTIRLLDTSNKSFELSGGDKNFVEATGISNNTALSVLEGVSLRVFGHAGQE